LEDKMKKFEIYFPQNNIDNVLKLYNMRQQGIEPDIINNYKRAVR